MFVSLTIIRYPKAFIPFALLAMAIHRLPLLFKKNIPFWKLMGSGKNGSFDKNPDWQQWGILAVHESVKFKQWQENINLEELYGSFIAGWVSRFNCEVFTILLKPIESHGSWDGKKVFGILPAPTHYTGAIAVLTRATIRLNSLKSFWNNVEGVSRHMAATPGLVMSVGIGEWPLIKQATFSVWNSIEEMKQFAYKLREHTEVIRKTRQEKWYSEEMFTRFGIISYQGTIKGQDPMEGVGIEGKS